MPVNSNWLQYIDSAETVFEDLKLESRQLLSLKAEEACRLMENEAYKKDLWLWDQDWSIQTLKLKKQTVKKRKTSETNFFIEKVQSKESNKENENTNNNRDPVDNSSKFKNTDNQFEVLDESYIESIDNIEPQISDTKLSTKFDYLFQLKDLLPVKKPYLAGYPAWYRKLCTKPGKDPDWSPGANNITTSMQVSHLLLYLILFMNEWKIFLK